MNPLMPSLSIGFFKAEALVPEAISDIVAHMVLHECIYLSALVGCVVSEQIRDSCSLATRGCK